MFSLAYTALKTKWRRVNPSKRVGFGKTVRGDDEGPTWKMKIWGRSMWIGMWLQSVVEEDLRRQDRPSHGWWSSPLAQEKVDMGRRNICSRMREIHMTISEKYSLQRERPSHRWWSSPLVREKVGMGKIGGEQKEAYVSSFDKIPKSVFFYQRGVNGWPVLSSSKCVCICGQENLYFAGGCICILQARCICIGWIVTIESMNIHNDFPPRSRSIRVSGFQNAQKDYTASLQSSVIKYVHLSRKYVIIIDTFDCPKYFCYIRCQ